MHARATNTYRRVFLESASPTQVLDELYVRLIKDIELAKESIGKRDFAGKGKAISHGLAIVAELNAALDHTAAPEVCRGLARLYDFVRDRLQQANLRMEAKGLDDAVKIVKTIREAYQAAAK
jgi:flagellar protein FliS